MQQEDKEFDQNMGEAGTSFIRACHNLKRIHETLKYKRPGFLEWCGSKPGLKESTAYRMMDVAKMFPDSGNILIQSKEALYLLASPSTPESARAEAMDLVPSEGFSYPSTGGISRPRRNRGAPVPCRPNM